MMRTAISPRLATSTFIVIKQRLQIQGYLAALAHGLLWQNRGQDLTSTYYSST